MQHRLFVMRSSALFTVIVVGAAATASAEPKQEETSGRVSLNEEADQKKDAPRSPSDWVELATPTPAKHGKEFIVVGKDAGYFSKLRVDAAKGKTIVKTVKVYFEDGAVKNVRVDRTLSAKGARSTTIDLGDAKAIERVVITTERHTKGEYSLYGSSGASVVGSR